MNDKVNKMKKSGLAFHCHHDVLLEYVYDYDERVRFIKENKPEKEQELRLRLFQMIPDEFIPGRDSPEWAAYDKAGAAYDKANRKELEALHLSLCPDCPWNGRTIFRGKNRSQ